MESALQGSTAEAISTKDEAIRAHWLKDATCISDARVGSTRFDNDDDYVILELRHDTCHAEGIKRAFAPFDRTANAAGDHTPYDCRHDRRCRLRDFARTHAHIHCAIFIKHRTRRKSTTLLKSRCRV
jgi:hypothetical protein